jgi:FKBP-type peptidyl-prolyl cis-trans isomerase FklB
MKKIGFAFILSTGVMLINGCNTPPAASTNSKAASSTATTTAVTATAVTNAASTASTASAADTTSQTNLLSSDKERESYAVGMYLAHGWMAHNVDLDSDTVFKGIKDEEAGKTLLTDQDMGTALRQLQASVRAAAEKAQQEAMLKGQQDAQKNMQAGNAFLDQNRSQPGVVTLPDGLQYKIIKDGDGPMPGSNDLVKVNYRGTLIDGKEFDSSAKAGHPAEFPVRGVIPGWTEALEMMKVGSKWQLFIPSGLAYGTQGRPPVIEPNSTLIFDVELLSIEQAPPAPPPPQPLTSDIIKVPSADEMKKGAQIETIKASDLQKLQQAQTNQ